MRSPAWIVPALSLLTACNLLTERSSEPPMISGPDMPTPVPAPTGPSVPLEVGPTQVAKRTLPPISGGTLVVGRVGANEVAVASDPEHDKVWVIDPKKSKPQGVAFEEGAEPGRAVLAGPQAVVALRRAGELAVIDVAKGELSRRLPVCAAPRGLDVDQAADLLAVACMGGELKLYRASTLEPVASYQLDRDLRDVVIRGEEILVTRFRSAEVLVVLKDGTVRDRAAPAPAQAAGVAFGGDSSVQPAQSTASVAWRMVSSADGGAVVLHQRGTDGQVQVTQPGGYGGAACGGIVQGALSSVNKRQITSSGGFSVGLAVDVATSPDGAVAIAVASDAPDSGKNFGVGPKDSVQVAGCGAGSSGGVLFDGPTTGTSSTDVNMPMVVTGVAVAFSTTGQLVSQTRSPHGVSWNDKFYAFGGDDEVQDTGHRIFHMNTGAGIACASCHPEGGDDGRVWTFEKSGKRRTQPLHGGLKGSEPFHWSGDESDFSRLMTDVFSHRMGGPQASSEQAGAVLDWVDKIPAPPPARTLGDEDVARGAELFASAAVGCAECHSGPRLASDGTTDVGTGEALQVPTLRGLAYRAPFLHDGCAPTLRDRFGACGGGDKHGKTSQLNETELGQLVAYLESL